MPQILEKGRKEGIKIRLLIRFRRKKEFLKITLKVTKQIDKYLFLTRKEERSNELVKKVLLKIPLFDKAIESLKAKRKKLIFSEQQISYDNKNNTMAFHSTMNETLYEKSHNQSEEKAEINLYSCNESFAESLRSVIKSLRTDKMSKASGVPSFIGGKFEELLESESFMDQKITDLEKKFTELKKAVK